MLSDVFTFVAQFGSIPVLIAGDLQADPASYSAVANCVAFHGWFDPVQHVDDSGHTSRPLTYSRDGTFSGSEDATSSIDATLVNSPAFFALKSAEVVPVIGKQHRPIKLVFQWKSIQQVGYTLLKSAPFLPDSLKPAKWDESATSDWSSFSERFESSDDSEVKWATINDFLVHSLRSQGAQWGHGPHTRGEAPVFIPKRVAPKQHRNSCAATKKSTALFKLVGRLQELFCRLSRAPGRPRTGLTPAKRPFVPSKAWCSMMHRFRGPIRIFRLLRKFFWLDSGLKLQLHSSIRKFEPTASEIGKIRLRSLPKGTVITSTSTCEIVHRMNPQTLFLIMRVKSSFNPILPWIRLMSHGTIFTLPMSCVRDPSKFLKRFGPVSRIRSISVISHPSKGGNFLTLSAAARAMQHPVSMGGAR